jgi:hypothetical protein
MSEDLSELRRQVKDLTAERDHYRNIALVDPNSNPGFPWKLMADGYKRDRGALRGDQQAVVQSEMLESLLEKVPCIYVHRGEYESCVVDQEEWKGYATENKADFKAYYPVEAIAAALAKLEAGTEEVTPHTSCNGVDPTLPTPRAHAMTRPWRAKRRPLSTNSG